MLFGLVAQLVRAPPCHGGGRGFEPHPGRLIEKCVERVSHDFLSEHCYGLSHSGVNRSMPNQRFVIPCSQPNVSAIVSSLMNAGIQRLKSIPDPLCSIIHEGS